MWISRPGNKEETFGNWYTVFKWTRYYLLFLVISLVLPIVISISNHGKSDGLKILLDDVDEQYMTKVKLAPEKFEEFRESSIMAIFFLCCKNVFVLCLHFFFFYFLTNQNCSILDRDVYLKSRIASYLEYWHWDIWSQKIIARYYESLTNRIPDTKRCYSSVLIFFLSATFTKFIRTRISDLECILFLLN